MNYKLWDKLINFLQDELAIGKAEIEVASRYGEQTTDSLPMSLWQYGLVSLEQLDKIFDWLETA
ncbi:MAG: DUF2949 domain-containing protein [Spirulinaceae cyanobacterium]